MRIAVTGASGLLGTAVAAAFEAGGHAVTRIGRGRRQAGGPDVTWDPPTGRLDRDALEGIEAVVHLAGENLAAGRWTAARKARIVSSRLDGTRLLAATLARLGPPPAVLVSASAVGIYGDRGEAPLTEASEPGLGFLPDLCRAWEAATAPAEAAGIRVVHLRLGVALTRRGGALKKMLLPFKLGLGGRVGRGGQWWSWIHLDDVVGVVQHVLAAERLAGPVNATAPNAVPSRTFARTLGRVLRRPAVVPLPAAMVRLLFGEMGQAMLLEGCRVLPARLLESGYRFRHPELEDALRTELAAA